MIRRLSLARADEFLMLQRAVAAGKMKTDFKVGGLRCGLIQLR